MRVRYAHLSRAYLSVEIRLLFYPFDVLRVNGEHVCRLPLLERKRRLLAIIPAIEYRLLYGRDLFRMACESDLEGIVAEWARGPVRRPGGQRRG
jgi:ATP-dependent DNA ligase